MVPLPAQVRCGLVDLAGHLCLPVDGVNRGSPRRKLQLVQHSNQARPGEPSRVARPVPLEKFPDQCRDINAMVVPPPAQIGQQLAQVHGRVCQAGSVEVEQADPISRREDVVALEVAVAEPGFLLRQILQPLHHLHREQAISRSDAQAAGPSDARRHRSVEASSARAR